jgi:hypothetical protein
LSKKAVNTSIGLTPCSGKTLPLLPTNVLIPSVLSQITNSLLEKLENAFSKNEKGV